MLIANILLGKGAAVHTLPSDCVLERAAKELHERKVGALVVVDAAGAVAGVLSERDIVREAALKGAACLKEPASSAMSRGVVTADPGETVDACLSRMTDRRIRHLPVLERGELVGIVSIGDLVKHKIMEAEAEAAAMQAYIAAQ
jgi:CBS domain-containing protein